MPLSDDQLRKELSKYHQPIPAVERPLFLRMLLYGTWGVGKTLLSCRIGSNPLLMVTEPSDDTLRDWPEIAARVDVVEYGGINHLRMIGQGIQAGIYKNDTLIVDTASELIEEQLDFIKLHWKSPKETRPKFQGKSAGTPDIEVSGTDDYRLVRDGLRPVIKELCQLPINLIFTSHERDVTWSDEKKLKDDGTPLPPYRPDLPSQTLKLIAKRVSVVGRMTRQGNNRTLSFTTDNRLKEEVKSRIKELDGRRMTDEEFITAVNNWRER